MEIQVLEKYVHKCPNERVIPKCLNFPKMNMILILQTSDLYQIIHIFQHIMVPPQHIPSEQDNLLLLQIIQVICGREHIAINKIQH